MKQGDVSLSTPVHELGGLGPDRLNQLARLGLGTVEDLLWHRPRRYEDRSRLVRAADLEVGMMATVQGRIVAMGVKRFRGGRQSVFELIVEDGTARLHCRWWNLPFMKNYFKEGEEVFVYGKVNRLKPRTIDHPDTEVVEEGDEASAHLNRIVPIYPLTEGMGQRWIRSLVWRVLGGVDLSALDDRDFEGFLSRSRAVRLLHFPEDRADTERARQRLALDELYALQFEIQRRRRNLQRKTRGLDCRGDNRLMKPFLRELGFELTRSQTGALKELREDLGGEFPMRRLLQGDVGSGKTVVAAGCALMALESGRDVVLMAPTEILAEQHRETFRRWFEPLGIRVMLRTGSWKDEATPEFGLAGARTIHIGTHALVSEGFEVDNLGLVIIDEQHKFGVAQREALLKKGDYPHLLVMTATPIPRTLGLTVYGDLDVTVMRHPPAGRGRIRTFVRTPDRLPKVWEFIREKLREGRQVYVVYPRVEEAGVGVKAVMREAERLKQSLAPCSVGVMHGRLKGPEKEVLMQGFRRGEIQVLLSTSVIEVGVDVANATVMLIENAEQFGLAQLHQLRGRIGRGALDSYCILAAEQKTEESKERLAVLERTSDGFEIAEEDLRLRGPGELLGQNQSGIPPFRFADLRKDLGLVQRARDLAVAALRSDGT